MIKPICDKCKKELDGFGALIFSPPSLRFMGEKPTCEKYHICFECFDLLIGWIKNGK